MHLINGTLYSLLLFAKTRSKRDCRRPVLFVKIVIYDRNKISNSKELFFCEAVSGNCGVFLFTLSITNLEAYRLASLV